MSPTLRHRSAPAVSETEIGRAWRRYLRETREAERDEYGLAEERAWARLASDPAALGAPLAPPDGSTDRSAREAQRDQGPGGGSGQGRGREA